MKTEVMIAIGVGVVILILVVVLSIKGSRALREAKYDFMRLALLANNCCLLAALVHLVYMHKDYYAFGYLLPIFASYGLFFSKKFKDLD